MYVKLNENSLNKLGDFSESGMDFYVFSPDSYRVDDEFIPDMKKKRKYLFVRSSGRASVVKPDAEGGINFNSLRMEFSENPVLEVVLKSKISSITYKNKVSLPTGNVSSVGAHELLGTHTYIASAILHRFTSTKKDRRFNNGVLAKDTYFTTESDQNFVNTGFGVVGRYALPMPVPSSFHHMYLISKGTIVNVGTVAPNYGQSGGGVEVSLSQATTATHIITNEIYDF